MPTIEHHEFVYTLKITSDLCYKDELQKKEQLKLENNRLINIIFDTFKDYNMEVEVCKDI